MKNISIYYNSEQAVPIHKKYNTQGLRPWVLYLLKKGVIITLAYKPSDYYHVTDNKSKGSDEPKLQIYGRGKAIDLDLYRLHKSRLGYLRKIR